MTRTQDDMSRAMAMIKADPMPVSRVARLLKSPVKSAVIQANRALGLISERRLDLIWGDRFIGVIPEAVSSLIWRFGFYERETSLYVMSTLRPGDGFIDVGAHFGYFTLLASRLCGDGGKVIAVEPMPATFRRLSDNIRENACSNVSTFNLALSDRRAQLEFKDYGIVNSSLNTSSEARGVLSNKSQAAHAMVKVEARLGDEIVSSVALEPVRLIKIDAESSELLVLKGLAGTIRQWHPSLIVEVGGHGPGEVERAQAIFEYLRSLGYDGYSFDGQQKRKIVLDGSLSYMNAFFEWAQP